MKILVGILMFVTAPSVLAQTQPETLFPFGLKEHMRVTDVIDAARESGLEPVTRIDEKDLKSITIHPRNATLGNQAVDCYHTEFFRDQLWGVNVSLEGSEDVNQHIRQLQELIDFVKVRYPGNVKSCRMDKMKSSKERMFAYVLEMKYGPLLVTVISDYDTSRSKYTAAVTYTMHPEKSQSRASM